MIAVRDFLAARFPEPVLGSSAARFQSFLLGLAEHGITGGRVYDALIATVASEAGATLQTCDTRAAETYARCGAQFDLIGAVR